MSRAVVEPTLSRWPARRPRLVPASRRRTDASVLFLLTR
jgi:hypothetical protein